MFHIKLKLIILSSTFTGKTVTTQIIPIPDSVQNIPGRMSVAKEEIVFIADNLPSLGYRSYYVSAVNGKNKNEIIRRREMDTVSGLI